MNADQFVDWPGDGTGRVYQLVDGEPQAMAPPGRTHGRLHARLVYHITAQLRLRQSGREVVIGPGVRPRPDMAHNVRVPDLVVTCTPTGGRFVDEPVVIAQILSPSNARETREAVRACLSIPSLREVLILGSETIVAELLRLGPDGTWPMEPDVFGPGEMRTLESIGVMLSLTELYEGLGLV